MRAAKLPVFAPRLTRLLAAAVAAAVSVSTLAQKVALPTADVATIGVESEVELAERAHLDLLEQVAREQHAADQGLNPSTLVLQHAVIGRYPTLNASVYAYKYIDEVGGVHSVIVDALGALLDETELARAEKRKYEAEFGRLHPTLAERVAHAAVGEMLPVNIWLKLPHPPSADESKLRDALSDHEMSANLDRIRQERMLATEVVAAPLADYLVGIGFELERDVYEPILYTALDPRTLAAISRLDEIDTIYLNEPAEPDMTIARRVVRADVVNARTLIGNVRVTGHGVKVGVVEAGGGQAFTHPFLAGIVEDPQCSAESAHGTLVAGIIRSTGTLDRGIAPDCALRIGGSSGVCTLTDRDAASTRAIAWGARVLNLSWHSNTTAQLTDNDRFYDSKVFTDRVTVVKSAGNTAGGCGNGSGLVTSPGKAYSVITAGGYDDRSTVADTDDTFYYCSSYVDPVSTFRDREKPELSAPAVNISAINQRLSGTSFAAPIVTGIVALLMERDPTLQTKPEAVKAVLMASAKKNIEGAARLSEKDGAGGVRADLADDVLTGTNGGWGASGYDCAGEGSRTLATVVLVSGKKTRIVICWGNDPDFPDYSNRPAADLDLLVFRQMPVPGSPSHYADESAPIATSLSRDNTYEIVEFTPPTSGPYSIRVARTRCDMSPRMIAYAWSREP